MFSIRWIKRHAHWVCLLAVGCVAANEPAPQDTNAKDLAVDEATGKVLRHAVFFSFKDTSSEQDVQGVADTFAGLESKIDVITDFPMGHQQQPRRSG